MEHIGTDTWQSSIGCLAFNGRLVTSGAHTGVYGRINIQELFIKQLTIIGSYLGSRHELAQLLKVVAQGKVKPAIDSVYPLEGAKEAHQMMEEKTPVRQAADQALAPLDFPVSLLIPQSSFTFETIIGECA